jgi:hypothetical protein
MYIGSTKHAADGYLVLRVELAHYQYRNNKQQTGLPNMPLMVA